MVGQQDLGSSLLFFTLFVVMMWVATERVGYLVIGLVLFAGAAYVVVAAVRPRADPRRHLARPVGATRSTRATRSSRRCTASPTAASPAPGSAAAAPAQVPEAQNDFIFAAIGEELGLFGAAAVLMAYLLLIGAGLRTALRTDRTFEKLLAVGLTTIVGVQAFIIIGGVIKVVPLTGITLPFVSYGGSSLRRQLHPARPADPPQRLRRPPPRRAARRPDAGGALGGLAPATPRRHRPDHAAEPAREPPDPPARRRPDGLLRRAVRRPQLLAGRPQAGARRRSSTTPAPMPREFDQPRGPIVTADGVVAARVGAEPAGQRRSSTSAQYPTGDLFANVTGYYTFAFGSTQLERTQNDVLTGDTAEQQLRGLAGICQRRATTSGTVQLTLRTTSSRSPRTRSATARARSS